MQELPAELKPWIYTETDAEAFGIDEFLVRLAKREETDVERALRHARAVFFALVDALSPEAMAHHSKPIARPGRRWQKRCTGCSTASRPKAGTPSLPVFPADPKGLASRESSGQVLNVLGRNVPWLMGGAADLAPSTKTRLIFDGAGDFEADSYHARNFHFGIREHAMCAMADGMSLVKVRPFASTFLIFTDYARGAIRLSALMEIPVIYISTHESISVGEDGPTHQPIEQLASLRAMPGILVIRPADANEVTEAWRVILPLRHEPTVLVRSRQLLPTLDRTRYAPASGLARGGYVHCAPPADPGQIRLRARPCDRGGQGPAGPLAPGMSHVPALSAKHQKKGRMP